jgi:hypothetical protein
MKAVITSIAVAIILALIPCLPPLVEGSSGEVTITMNTESVMAITLSQTNWPIGDVASNTEKMTSPAATWCTITNSGNANINIYIQGEDAQWVGRPVNTYKWTLSNDGTNGDHKYVLRYHIANDNEGSYTLVTTGSVAMKHVKVGSDLDGKPLNLRAHDDYAQFGLKLLTPTFFYGGRQMETHITISAVTA